MYRLLGLSIFITAFLGSPVLASRRVTYYSPDRTLKAVDAVKDRKHRDESIVEIRDRRGKLLCRRDFTSDSGHDGYQVAETAWTPDSRFFIFSIDNIGGHQPWTVPTYIYSRRLNRIISLGEDLHLPPTDDFHLHPHDILTTHVLYSSYEYLSTGLPITIHLRALSHSSTRHFTVSGYKFTPLPGKDLSSATGVNDYGQVVGCYGDPDPRTFLWEDGRMTDLTTQGFPGLPGGINDSRIIVGDDSLGHYHGGVFLWRMRLGTSPKIAYLPGLSDANVCVDGINNNNQIVGILNPGNVPTVGTPVATTFRAKEKAQVFVWNSGRLSTLDIWPQDNHYEEIGINDEGTIVGSAGVGRSKNFSSFSWVSAYKYAEGRLWKNGHLSRRLPLLHQGQDVFLHGINSYGQLVGESWPILPASESGIPVSSAILWDHGRWTDLNTMLPSHSNYHLETANAISNLGYIVGDCIRNWQSSNPSYVSFLLTPTALVIH